MNDTLDIYDTLSDSMKVDVEIYTNNLLSKMDVTLDTFYDSLSNIMKSETYTSSYSDFKYMVKENNSLLEAIKNYTKENPFYREYNISNPYGIITDIRHIYCGEHMLSEHMLPGKEGSRGRYSSGYYHVDFTVMFNLKARK